MNINLYFIICASMNFKILIHFIANNSFINYNLIFSCDLRMFHFHNDKNIASISFLF